MGLLRWFTHNVADTDAGTHPDLAPLDVPLPVQDALPRVAAAVASLPRWQLESVEPGSGTLRATRRTRLFRFVDDVTVRLESTPDGVRVHARSASRLGKGDLGQNRRNLLELFAALRKHLGNA